MATPSQAEATQQQNGDVWEELYGIVRALSDVMDSSLQAFVPDAHDKVVSATTRKRMVAKALLGLRQSKETIAGLTDHLNALREASQQWQRTMMYASKSHQELMEQLESTSRELHKTSERQRALEAQRLAAGKDADALRQQLAHAEQERLTLQAALKKSNEDLETSQFAVNEAQSELSHLRDRCDSLAEAAASADRKAEGAVAILDSSKAETAKAVATAERQKEVVAKLTGDNLMFVMQLRKAEADLAAANQERAALRLAVEKQRGPWFDQVRAGVEERVRDAMARAESLEAELAALKQQHQQELQALQAQHSDLEEFVSQLRSEGESLRGRLQQATAAQARSDTSCLEAQAAAEALRHQLEDLSAENRVLQDSVKAMRQECTERWVTEQGALGKVAGLETAVARLEGLLAEQREAAAVLQAAVDGHVAMNRQLMAKKEETEWQLMAALAKLEGGAAGQGPIPLNLMVSGLLSVARDKQHSARDGAPTGGDGGGRCAANGGRGGDSGGDSGARICAQGCEVAVNGTPGSGCHDEAAAAAMAAATAPRASSHGLHLSGGISNINGYGAGPQPRSSAQHSRMPGPLPVAQDKQQTSGGSNEGGEGDNGSGNEGETSGSDGVGEGGTPSSASSASHGTDSGANNEHAAGHHLPQGGSSGVGSSSTPQASTTSKHGSDMQCDGRAAGSHDVQLGKGARALAGDAQQPMPLAHTPAAPSSAYTLEPAGPTPNPATAEPLCAPAPLNQSAFASPSHFSTANQLPGGSAAYPASPPQPPPLPQPTHLTAVQSTFSMHSAAGLLPPLAQRTQLATVAATAASRARQAAVNDIFSIQQRRGHRPTSSDTNAPSAKPISPHPAYAWTSNTVTKVGVASVVVAAQAIAAPAAVQAGLLDPTVSRQYLALSSSATAASNPPSQPVHHAQALASVNMVDAAQQQQVQTTWSAWEVTPAAAAAVASGTGTLTAYPGALFSAMAAPGSTPSSECNSPRAPPLPCSTSARSYMTASSLVIEETPPAQQMQGQAQQTVNHDTDSSTTGRVALQPPESPTVSFPAAQQVLVSPTGSGRSGPVKRVSWGSLPDATSRLNGEGASSTSPRQRQEAASAPGKPPPQPTAVPYRSPPGLARHPSGSPRHPALYIRDDRSINSAAIEPVTSSVQAAQTDAEGVAGPAASGDGPGTPGMATEKDEQLLMFDTPSKRYSAARVAVTTAPSRPVDRPGAKEK